MTYECAYCGLTYGYRGLAHKCGSEIEISPRLLTDGGSDLDGIERPKRFGPVSLSSTDADGGSRLYLSQEAIEESGFEVDGAVILQPFENGIHVIDAGVAVFGACSVDTDCDCQKVIND